MGQISGYSETGGTAADPLAVLRHELANVLNGLAGMARLLKSSSPDPEQEHWLEAIDSSVGQMRFLLRSLEQGGKEAEPAGSSPFNGLDALEQLVTAHSPGICDKGLRPLLVLAPELPIHWHGDSSLVRQLLDNLLCNAAKFTETGDVVVSARPGEERSLHLSVSDTGPGVPEMDRQRIFHVGERGSSVGDCPGSGLGLSLCQHIAHRLGGEISCSGNYGRGSVFSVTLPGVLGAGCGVNRPGAVLEDVHCALELDARLCRSITGFLDRLGVGWNRSRNLLPEHQAECLVITVVEAERLPGEAWAGIELRPVAGPEADGLRLRPPVLFTTFERAILRLALAWRWQRLSAGGKRG